MQRSQRSAVTSPQYSKPQGPRSPTVVPICNGCVPSRVCRPAADRGSFSLPWGQDGVNTWPMGAVVVANLLPKTTPRLQVYIGANLHPHMHTRYAPAHPYTHPYLLANVPVHTRVPRGHTTHIVQGACGCATKSLYHFSTCACHPCAGAMLIFSVSFQF